MPYEYFNGDRRNAKLTEAQAERVILDRGRTPDATFAAEFGVKPATIANVRLGRSWWSVRERLIEEGKIGHTEGE